MQVLIENLQFFDDIGGFVMTLFVSDEQMHWGDSNISNVERILTMNGTTLYIQGESKVFNLGITLSAMLVWSV